MKILLIGTVAFSAASLKKLIDLGHSPVAVISKAASPYNADFVSLAPLCEQHRIDCRIVEDVDDETVISWIRDKRPDVIFCFGWSSLLQKSVFDIAPLGTIGFHPTALPQNRGRHPIIWALALGLPQTASTFFFMDEGADTGDILSQEVVPIHYEDDAGNLYARVRDTAMNQIESFVPQLIDGSYTRVPQNHKLANNWRKRSKADGRIDFRMSSRAVYNLVRALTRPYVGGHIEYKGEEYKVWKVEEHDISDTNIEPGKVLISSLEELVIKCGDNAVRIIEHELDQLPEEGEYLI
jgi:methionyl-tRNA formyltransferase